MTIDTEVVQSERETEDPRYVKVDRNSLEDAEKTIEKLQKTITEQRNHISMLTYVLYALIAVSIVFLFIVISQLLRRRDMAQELAFYKQEDPYHTSVGEDGWGEWGEDDIDRGGRRRKKSAADDGWDEEPVNPASEWANQQVGTPVRPQHYASKQQAPREQGNRDRGQAPREQGGRDKSQALAQAGSRQASVKTQGTGDETKRYEAVPPVHPQEVPKDVTKDLSRVNKAEAKAMKKAAAAETKREMDEKRAERARAEEAKRQAKEAQRLEKEQEAARRAQENALQEAERREAEEKQVSANPDAEKGKNVEINMVDL